MVIASPTSQGDLVLVEAHEQIPATAKIIVGVASVDESAITGESAPVIRPPERPLARSPAAPRCSPTGSWSASPLIRGGLP